MVGRSRTSGRSDELLFCAKVLEKALSKMLSTVRNLNMLSYVPKDIASCKNELNIAIGLVAAVIQKLGCRALYMLQIEPCKPWQSNNVRQPILPCG